MFTKFFRQYFIYIIFSIFMAGSLLWAGVAVYSHRTTVRAQHGNTPPTVSDVVLAQQPSGDLSLTYDLSDADSDPTTGIVNWKKNGTAIAQLNMPFDSNVTSTDPGAVLDYSSYENNGTLGRGKPTWQNATTCGNNSGGCYDFDGMDDYIKVSGPPGKVTTAVGSGDDFGQSAHIQTDGKIVAVGYSSNGSNFDFALVRYNADLSLDTTFGNNGKVTTAIGSGADVANFAAIQSDGKIVAAGYATMANNDFALVRYNADGSPDTTFGTGGKLTTNFGSSHDSATSVAIQSDGKIVAAGYASMTNVDFALVRYNADGSPDTTFGTGGKVTTAIGSSDDFVSQVILQSDGKIVAAGWSYNGSKNDFALARYNTNGTPDTSFGTGGIVTTGFGTINDTAASVAIQSDGKIVAAGRSHNGSNLDFALARYNADGTLDTTFDGDGKVTTAIGSGNDQIGAVGIQGDGKIVAGGQSHNGINFDFALARYNTDGSLDTTFSYDGWVTADFGTGDDHGGRSIVFRPDDKIVYVGRSSNGPNFDFGVVRYNTDGTLDDLNALNTFSQMSVEAWVNIDDYSSGQDNDMVVKKYRWEAGYGGFAFGLGYAPDYPDDTFGFALVEDTTINLAMGSSLPSLDTWHYMVGTYDGTNMKFYMDGSEVATTPTTFGAIDSTGSDLIIGGEEGYRLFNGKIDEVRLYDYALSAEQVARNYNNGVPLYNTIVAEETNAGETWEATVTPNDSTVDGIAVDSNTVTVAGAPVLSCGDTLTANTTLTENLTGCTGGGLTIGANNVTLDCAGHTLSGNGSNIGVTVANGLSGVTVKNCTITGFNKGVTVDTSTNFSLLDNTITIQAASGSAGLYIQGANTGMLADGNYFEGSGVVYAPGATGTDYGLGIEGQGNEYIGVDEGEVAFDPNEANDLDGNGEHDSYDGTVLDSLIRHFGKYWVAGNSLQRAIVKDTFDTTELATFDRNCTKLSEFTSEYSSSCASIETTLAVDHPNGINAVEAMPVGAWDVDHASGLRFKDSIPANVNGAKIDVLFGDAIDGSGFGATIYGAAAGTGSAALAALAAVEYKFTPPAGTVAYCNGTPVSTGATHCEVLEFVNDGNTLWSAGFSAGAQALPYKNEDGRGMDDQITGVDDVSERPTCDPDYNATHSAEGFTCTEPVPGFNSNADVSTAQDPETTYKDGARAYIDVTDSGYSEDATGAVHVSGGVIIVTIEPPAGMPAGDEQWLGGKPRKMSMGMGITLGPKSGRGAPIYTINNKNITTVTGIGFASGGQADSPAAIASNVTFNGNTFSAMNFTADVNVRETADELGTLLIQGTPGAGESVSGAVGKAGGSFEFTNNTVINAEDPDSTVSGAVRSALEASDKLHGDYVGFGVGYADTNGQSGVELSEGVIITGNTFNNVAGGIGVFGALAKIENNTINLYDSLAYKARIDAKAAQLYPDHPLDYQGVRLNDATGPANPTMRDDLGAAHKGGGVGIAVACGHRNITQDGREGTTEVPNSEQDTFGNFIDLLDEGSDHDNCDGYVIIRNNTLTSNFGTGINVAGEWAGDSDAQGNPVTGLLCSENPSAPGCTEMKNMNVLVSGNTLQTNGIAPIDEPGTTVTYEPSYIKKDGNLVPVPADGFDSCMNFGAPLLEELENVDTNSPKETADMDNDGDPEEVTAHLPHYYVTGNTCGTKDVIGSGGVVVGGGTVTFFEGNNIYKSQLASFVGLCDARGLYENNISDKGLNAAGNTQDCVIRATGNELLGCGALGHTITQKYIGESKVGANDGILTQAAVNACIGLVYDNAGLYVPDSLYIIDNNIAETNLPGEAPIAFEVSGVTGTTAEIQSYFDAISTSVVENTTPAGEPAEVVVVNEPSNPVLEQVIAAVLEDAVVDADNDGTEDEFDDCPTLAGPADRKGCPYADITNVKAFIVDLKGTGVCGYLPNGKAKTVCEKPVEGASVKVFDRENADFKAAYTNWPSRNLLDNIFEANIGLAGACTTNAGGTCTIGEDHPGKFLVISKYTEGTKNVYTGRFKNFKFNRLAKHVEEDDEDTGNVTPPTTITKNLYIMKTIRKDGTVIFLPGFRTVITGSALNITYPEYTLWNGDEELYPFAYESAENWDVDVCMNVPAGYQLAGILDENEQVVSTSECLHALVAGTPRVFLFKLIDIASPEPSFNFTLTAKHNNKVTKKTMKVDGIRQKNVKKLEANVEKQVLKLSPKWEKASATIMNRLLKGRTPVQPKR